MFSFCIPVERISWITQVAASDGMLVAKSLCDCQVEARYLSVCLLNPLEVLLNPADCVSTKRSTVFNLKYGDDILWFVYEIMKLGACSWPWYQQVNLDRDIPDENVLLRDRQALALEALSDFFCRERATELRTSLVFEGLAVCIPDVVV